MSKVKTGLLLLLLSACLSAPALAADYPARSITVVNPFLPGGIVDLAFRPVSEEMSKILGVTIVNSPQPGAGGVIATTKALQAKPDGYTLLIGSDGFFMTTGTLRKVRFTTDDVIPIHSNGVTPMALAIKKGDPRFSTVEEFIAYGKAHPGELSVGQTSMLGTNHVATALLESKLGLSLKIIPFDGALQTVSALVSGHIDCAISEILYNQDIHALALFGTKSAEYPNVPTFTELGYPINWGSNFGLFADKDVPPEVIAVLRAAMAEAVKKQSVIDNVRNLGLGATFYNGDEWLDIMKPRRAVMEEIIAAGVITPEK